MEGITIGMTVLNEVQGWASQVIAPAMAVGQSELRYQLGFTDVANKRLTEKVAQLRSTGLNVFPQPVLDFNIVPAIFNVQQAILSWNQAPWNLLPDDPPLDNEHNLMLAQHLGLDGIRIQRFREEGTPENIARAREWNKQIMLWWRSLQFTSKGPSIEGVIKSYYRGNTTEEELQFNFQRGTYRRAADRKLLLEPPFPWSPQDAMRLVDGGRIEIGEYNGILKAAGVVQPEDRRKLHALASPQDVQTVVTLFLRGAIDFAECHRRLALAGVVNEQTRDGIIKMAYHPPGPGEILSLTNADVWNEEVAEKYGMDDGIEEAEVARWWWEASGASKPGGDIPGPNGEGGDWFRMAWRATRKLPEYGLMRVLQHRLRPSGDDDGESVIDGVREWTEEDTMAMLGVANVPDEIARQMAALIYEPINIRLINHILGPYSTHPEVRAAADEAFGEGVDWVELAMLDHGFDPKYAKVAAVGIHAQADDRDNAERKQHEKRVEDDQRKHVLGRYKLGILTWQQVVDLIVTDQYPEALAVKEMELIDQEFDDKIKEKALHALQESWMTGKLNAEDIRQSITQLGVSDVRRDQILGAWIWERTEKTRMLTTGEVISLMKDGLMSPAIAQARLVNLGWSAPDALIEIAQVQQSLAQAAAKTAAATATHMAAAAAKAHAESLATAKAAAIKAEKERLERAKVEKAVNNAAHEKLLATSEYYARVHASNASYVAATKAGNDQKQQAEINKQIALYQKYLLDQLHLIQQGPEVADVVAPIDTVQAAGAEQAARGNPLAEPTAPKDSGSGGGDQQSG